jgi:signal transduction histidine kinase
MRTAERQESTLRRQFYYSYFGGLFGALLAGSCVVGLVWHSGRLARERSRFAAAAAHELRTPLAGIRLHGEMLAGSLGNPARIERYAQRITDEAERLGRVVANVVNYSREDQRRLTLDQFFDAADQNLAGVGRVNASQHVEKRGLATPAGTLQDGHLAGLNLQVDPFQHRIDDLPDTVLLA